MTQGFKHRDKMAAISLAERNSNNTNGTKSIVVQHFNDAGIADSPASLVTTQVGHSPVAETAINDGYFLATEFDPEQALQALQNAGRSEQQSNRQYQNR